jgi:hypothetical protein
MYFVHNLNLTFTVSSFTDLGRLHLCKNWFEQFRLALLKTMQINSNQFSCLIVRHVSSALRGVNGTFGLGPAVGAAG